MSHAHLPSASPPPLTAGAPHRSLYLAAALSLWAMASWLLLFPLPRSVHIAQEFGVSLPWLTGLAAGVPLWAVAATILAACVAGVRSVDRRGRLLWLLVVPATAVLVAVLCTFVAMVSLRGAMAG